MEMIKATIITDTIVAHCTPSGPGAIALIRVSGPDAVAITAQCAQLSLKKSLLSVETHTIHHGWVVAKDGKLLDEVLFFVMHAPRTFTGQTVVEISTHNNPFIIESIVQELIACGARPAQRGEFTRQAVESGKLDLVQAEAINELIHANSEQLLQQSLQQLKGSFSHWIVQLETQLLKLIALCEASFEFLEEEVDFSGPMQEALKKIFTDIGTIKQSFDQQQQLRNGIRIALVGSVNAGKSSLFNALIGKNRAIVTDIAGTTRDVIETGIYKDGVYLTLIDTAGLRQTADIIEQQGIERSYQEAQTADIILLVIDGSRVTTVQELEIYSTLLERHKEKIITLINKIDQPEKHTFTVKDYIKTCAQNKVGIEELNKAIQTKITQLFAQNNSPFLVNKRHFTLLTSFEQKLKIVETMLTGSIEYELVAYHLKDALETLTELTGKSVSEKAMDTVFKEFCVGK